MIEGFRPGKRIPHASPFRRDLSEICNGILLTLKMEFANIMETFPSVSIYYQFCSLKIYRKLQLILAKALI